LAGLRRSIYFVMNNLAAKKQMQISVKLIANYRQKLPEGTKGNTCQMNVPIDTVVRQIVERFEIAYDASNVILLNGHVSDPEQKLKNGDVICVFSAVAGG